MKNNYYRKERQRTKHEHAYCGRGGRELWRVEWCDWKDCYKQKVFTSESQAASFQRSLQRDTRNTVYGVECMEV